MNDSYYIPTNFTDAGRVLGFFSLRNLVEAVLLVLPVLYLCIAFLPLDLNAKIMVTLVLVVPIGGLGLVGVHDDSLSRFLRLWCRWRWKRRRMMYRGEVSK